MDKVDAALAAIRELDLDSAETAELLNRLTIYQASDTKNAIIVGQGFAQSRIVERGISNRVIGRNIEPESVLFGVEVKEIIRRVSQWYAEQFYSARAALEEMTLRGIELGDLGNSIAYVTEYASDAQICRQLETLAEVEAGEADLKVLAGELLKRLDVFDLAFKQVTGAEGLASIDPSLFDNAREIHAALELLSDNQPASRKEGIRLLRANASRENLTIAAIRALRTKTNYSKGNWATADRRYKQVIRDEGARLQAQDSRLISRNTATGRAIIRELESRSSLSEDESTALYNLKAWDKDSRLPKEMYHILNIP